MRKATLLVFVFLIGLALLPSSAEAQAVERVWEPGSVWTATWVETHPGQFNGYIKDLSHVWRAFLEEQMKTGDVLSYKILSVQNTRDGEPDLLLLTELKNMAVLDQGPERFEELAKKVMGSLDDMQEANTDRRELRTMRGNFMAREILFME